MDTVNRYRQMVEQILRDYASIPYSHGEIESQTVFDRTSDHYLLMLVGSDGVQRVHGCLVHIDIKDGKIWIVRDGTDRGMARELRAAGVPPQDIILAFRAPEPPQPVSAMWG